MPRHKILNTVVDVVTVIRRADGVRCVVTAAEAADDGVYREVVPSAGVPEVPRRTKRRRDREIARGVYGGSHISGVL